MPSTGAVPSLGGGLLERPNLELIDLSLEIYEGMPIFSAHQRPFVMVNQTHDGFKQRFDTGVGFEVHNWLLSEHTGTHTDAILEYVEGGPGVDAMPLSYFYGPALCLDLSHVKYPDDIAVADLESAIELSGHEVQKGMIILLHTGQSEVVFPSKGYVEQCTGLYREAAQYLAELGVVNIAIDGVSIDHSDDPEFSGHVVCAEYNIANTENLTNLSQLVNRRCMFMGLPLKFRRGTGSPIRAVAWLEKEM